MCKACFTILMPTSALSCSQYLETSLSCTSRLVRSLESDCALVSNHGKDSDDDPFLAVSLAVSFTFLPFLDPGSLQLC